MIDVKIFKKSKQSGGGSSSSASTGYAGSTGSGKTGLADRAKRADYADEAGYAAYAGDLVATSPAFDRWLRKDQPDTAAGLITFLRGIALGTGYGITEEGRATLRSVLSNNFTPDLLTGTGWGAWLDENGISTIEVDNLNVRMKAVFSELEIRKISHSGGNLLFSSAGSKIQSVTPLDANGNETTAANAVAYRCDLFSDDGTTATMNDWWKDDQARCQQFNIKEGVYQNVSNRSYWRKVIDTESRTDEKGNIVNSVIIAAKSSGTYKGESYTKGQSSLYNDVPQAGDTIVQLGNQNPSNRQRQNAIELVTDGDNAPALLKYQGIDDYTLDGKLVQGEYYDTATHTFKSKTYGDWYVGRKEEATDGGYAEYDSATRTLNIQGTLKVGSTLEDGRDINHLGTSRGNLLKNTGFTGDFESVEVETEGQTITDAMPIYSDRLKYWDATNVEVIADTDSASGYSAKLGVLSQTVEGGWKEGEWYMLSLRAAQGSLTIEAGGEAKAATLTDWERIDFPFQASTTDGVVRFSGTAKVCEIMLTAGNLPTEWHKASTDNDKSMAEFFSLDYLRKAITDATTNIIGGLVMTQILKVGNYRGGQMSQETGGMSGAYNDDKSPFLWGGGTMEDAIYTIMKYAKNPAYQPTEEEVSRMAKFVVTHGGRAILNDIVLRGYIYALGGVFNGTVYAHDGVFTGFIGKKKTTVTPSNIEQYSTIMTDPITGDEYYQLNIEKTGTWIEFRDFTDYNVELHIPYTYGGTTSDEARALVGNSVLLYNYCSDSQVNLMMVGNYHHNDQPSANSFNIRTGHCAYMECKCGKDANGKEEIYWSYVLSEVSDYNS